MDTINDYFQIQNVLAYFYRHLFGEWEDAKIKHCIQSDSHSCGALVCMVSHFTHKVIKLKRYINYPVLERIISKQFYPQRDNFPVFATLRIKSTTRDRKTYFVKQWFASISDCCSDKSFIINYFR